MCVKADPKAGHDIAATVIYSNGASQDITAAAAFSSTLPNVATITPAGLASGVSPGATPISASSEGVTGSTPLTVTAATLTNVTATPPNVSTARGTFTQVRLLVSFSDNSVQDMTSAATWTSGNPNRATVNNSDGTTQDLTGSLVYGSSKGLACSISAGGLVSGLATGAANITADTLGVTGTASRTVVEASGTIQEMASQAGPNWLAMGPNGNVWFTEWFGDRIGVIAP